MSLRTNNRRIRRLALERVEDRKLLAPVAFATGMESQLSALTANAASGGTLPLYVHSQPVTTNAGLSGAGIVWSNSAVTFGSFGLSANSAADVSIALSGGSQWQVITSGDLPPVQQPILPITFPSAPQGPIDIGPIVGNPIGPISGPRPSPTPPAPPVLAGPPGPSPNAGSAQNGVPATSGDGPTLSAAPPSAIPKPAVEGNGGKSQVIDVAVSTGDGPATTSALALSAVATTRTNPSAIAAVPNTAGVDAVMRSVARSDGATASSARGQVSARPTGAVQTRGATVAAVLPAVGSQSQGPAVAAVTAAIAPEPAIAIPGASSAEGGVAADASVVAGNAKRGAAAVRPLVAGIYQRADILGAAALVAVGHYATRRWRKTEAHEPRPAILWRKKQVT
jgi:hypothetical protein